MKNFRDGLNEIWKDEDWINNTLFESICELHNKFHKPLMQECELPISNATSQIEQLKDKKVRDLLNWVKSDIRQETNPKLGKKNTPYHREKLRFLYKIKDVLSV